MEFIIAAVLFVALLVSWFVLPAMPATSHIAETEGVVLATAQQNS